jgi:hypothetical protein
MHSVRANPYLTFDEFIKQQYQDPCVKLLAYWPNRYRDKWIQLNKEQRYEMLETGLSKLSKMAWTHDAESLNNLAEFVCGSAVEIENVNGNKDFKGIKVPKINFTYENMKLFEKCVLIENEYIKIAIDKGLLNEPNWTLMDDIFNDYIKEYTINFSGNSINKFCDCIK